MGVRHPGNSQRVFLFFSVYNILHLCRCLQLPAVSILEAPAAEYLPEKGSKVVIIMTLYLNSIVLFGLTVNYSPFGSKLSPWIHYLAKLRQALRYLCLH